MLELQHGIPVGTQIVCNASFLIFCLDLGIQGNTSQRPKVLVPAFADQICDLKAPALCFCRIKVLNSVVSTTRIALLFYDPF